VVSFIVSHAALLLPLLASESVFTWPFSGVALEEPTEVSLVAKAAGKSNLLDCAAGLDE